MQRHRCICSLTALAIIPSILFGQTFPFHDLKRRPVKIINFEQGLLNNETIGVITDTLGYTWISTRTGLQRFNGYNLDDINPVIGKDTIQIHSPVYLFALKNGTIWIAYEAGILAYDPFSNSFKKIISLPLNENSFFPILPLLQTKEGIWCLERDKGIVIYKDQEIKPEITESVSVRDINNLINSDNLINHQVIATNRNYIFILVSRSQLLQINTENHQIQYLNGIQGNIFGIGCTEQNLIFTTPSQVAEISIGNTAVAKSIPLKYFENETLNNSCIQPEGNGQLLISINANLFELDSTFRHSSKFSTLNEDPVVPSGSIHHLYVDRFRRIWLSTNNDIRLIQNFNIPFDHYEYKNETSNLVRSIYYDETSHHLLAGTIKETAGTGGGVQLFDSSGRPLWSKSMRTNQLRNIQNIAKIGPGQYLLIIPDGLGWYLLNLKKKQLDKIILPVNSALLSQVNTMVWPNNVQQITDSTFYVASSTNVYKATFHHSSLKKVEPLFPFNGSSTNQIDCFIYTSGKTLWAGTSLGYIYILKGTGTVDTLHIPGKFIIRCFAEGYLHHIWVGTDEGLFVYSVSGVLIKTFNNQAGLLNDYIYAVLPVKTKPAAFVSTKLGLSYISLNDSIKNYTKELGLQENEFNTESAAQTRNGKFYFGGVNGITSFYPSSITEVKDNPVLNITRLIIDGSLHNFSPEIWRHDSIILPYNENYLLLDVGALGLLNPDEYDYKYRLRGFEEKWQSTHVPTGINYVLPPGRYSFDIMCTPIFSSATLMTKTITIIIHPPWWETWWFRLVIISVFVMGIVAIVRQYSKRQFQRKIRALQLQHEIQVERERISRDLHDNIGAQLSFISSNMDWIIDKNVNWTKEDDLKQMKAINATTKNVMTNLRETIWALHKEKITIQEFSDKLKAYIQNLLQLQMGMEFISEEKIEENFVLTPAEMLNIFRICQECVNNVIKHAGATRLRLIIKADDKSFHILMEDDGIGFDYGEDFEGHYGLKNMQHRAAELNATLDIGSEKGKGTRVSIHRYLK